MNSNTPSLLNAYRFHPVAAFLLSEWARAGLMRSRDANFSLKFPVTAAPDTTPGQQINPCPADPTLVPLQVPRFDAGGLNQSP